MRTTLTLDQDVADRLKQLSRERALPFKQVVNDALRRGLNGGADEERYEVPVFNLGIRPEIDVAKIRHVMDDLDDEERFASR